MKTAACRSSAWLVLWGALALSPSTAAGQTLLWENRGQPEFIGAPIDIDASGATVIAAGIVGNATQSQWYVRGVDRRTGVTTWDDRFGPLLFGQARDASTRGNRVFVTGWILTPANGFVFVVRAYRLDTGAVLWSREVGLGPQCAAESGPFARCVAKALDVHDGRVFAVGHLTRTANRSDFAVLAFDGATGTPLWESVTDSGTGANDYAWAVKATGDGVFVYGETGDTSGLLLQAHDARTGAIRWQRTVPGGANFTLRQTLAADGRHVFIGGTDGEGRYMVRAYAAASGALLWTDEGEGSGEVTALTLGEEDGAPRLFATGIIGCNADFLECELGVRAYDPRHGLLWARAEAARAGDWSGSNVVAGGGRVFVNGGELLEDGQYHDTTRAYRARTGAPLWDEPFDPGVDPPGFSGLEAAGPRLFVGGRVFTSPDGTSDFILRRYRTNGHDEEDGSDEDE